MRVFAEDFQIGVALTFFAQFFRDTPKFLSAKSSFLYLYVALRIGVVLNHLGTEEGN